ncbi:interferon-stimulated 20 kDa exonuclease-like 2 [Carcharodon carcharias]|uniref:interferon-stimulated 20 kDa exonuclease-like 2 n=1 Tax=Carcharodon carcharias TaxID=13397 RepID=UPI001B7DDDB6|nr:interferon-stimulated 20 kDa exonuclease-like 2 [Carcharodon carcharias]
MSDLTLNLDFTVGKPKKLAQPNVKHQHFLKRRAYLERRGYLSKKRGSRAAPERGSSLPPAGWSNASKPCQPARAPLPGSCAGVTNGAQTPRSRPPGKGAIRPWKGPSPSSSRPPERDLLLGECQSSLPTPARGTGTGTTAPPSRPYKCVALDCEMVGTGQGGKRSELARCSVIGYDGDLVYDKYILPPNPITNYRTRWSGIRRQHMKNATPFKLAQKEILKVLCGKIVVGHAVHNDFKALNYFHPQSLTRDTSKIPLLNRKAGFPEKESVSLKRLTKQLLHRDIQVGKQGHSSVEDARATMELYRLVEAQLEPEVGGQPGQK